MSERPYDVAILPGQAKRIADVTAMTGAAVGLSQSGSVITIHTANVKICIDAKGDDIKNTDQEQFPC